MYVFVCLIMCVSALVFVAYGYVCLIVCVSALVFVCKSGHLRENIDVCVFLYLIMCIECTGMCM